MNIFTAIKSIISAANENYREQQKDKERFMMSKEALLSERRHRSLLRSKIEEILLIMNKNGYEVVQIAICDECKPFVNDAIVGLACTIRAFPDGTYLLESKEEELK